MPLNRFQIVFPNAIDKQLKLTKTWVLDVLIRADNNASISQLGTHIVKMR